jgi:hypothetical protein
MAKKPETRVQQSIRERLELEIGGFWVKIHGGPFQRAGMLDLLGCVFGCYINLEVKTEEDFDGASVLQLDMVDIIQTEHGCAFITTNPTAAVRKVKKFLLNNPIFSEQWKNHIRENLKTRALQVSTSGIERSAKKRSFRIVHGAGDWQDDYRLKSRRGTSPQELRKNRSRTRS